MSIRPCWPARDAEHLLVDAAAMASLEERLFATGLPVEALLEKAALAMAARLLARLGPPALVPAGQGPGPGDEEAGPGCRWETAAGVLVLVGPGYNGGDGLVIARELHLAGMAVRLWSPFDRHRPLTDAHLRHALWLGIPRLDAAPDPADAALWVDALFGTGQNRAPGSVLEALLEERQRQRPGQLVAVDGPTGVCADSGRLLGDGAATAALTWCLGLRKQGLLQDRALARVGRLELVPLGLPEQLLADLPAATPLALASADQVSAPWPVLDPAAAKYGRGRLLVVAGSARYPGAASLALAGASASGCGSLRAALPQEMAPQLWQRHPEVVLEARLPSGDSGTLRLEGLQTLALDRLDALLLGPGLGQAEAKRAGTADLHSADPDAAEAWQRLQAFAGLLLLDADGLNRLAGRRGEGASAWLQQRRGPTWITPHRGEFDRLFPTLSALAPLEAATAAADLSGASVLLKGARSVVAAADGRRWQLLQAAPQAARAGLGDTLAGFAAGRGAMALAAAAGHADACLLAAAVLEHAEAARRCWRQRGDGGVTPQAVAETLAGTNRSSTMEKV